MPMSPIGAPDQAKDGGFLRDERWHVDRMLSVAMNTFDQLRAQHGELEDFFHEITLARDVPTRAAILEELTSALTSHTALEDRLFPREEALTPRESGLCEGVLAALAEMDPADASFTAKAARLQDLFEDRIEYEETVLFPQLQHLQHLQDLIDGREVVGDAPMLPGAASPDPTTSLSTS